jgi:hypothetical protein
MDRLHDNKMNIPIFCKGMQLLLYNGEKVRNLYR